MEDRIPRLAELAAAAVAGETGRLRQAAQSVRENDGDEAMREVLRMLHLFYGFPTVVRAFGQLDDAGAPRADEPEFAAPSDAPAGHACFEELYGEDSGPVRQRLVELDGYLAAWILDHAYGRVLNRPVLTLAERERIAVLALAATGCWMQWESHVRNAARLGVEAAALAGDVECVDWLSADARERALRSLKTAS